MSLEDLLTTQPAAGVGMPIQIDGWRAAVEIAHDDGDGWAWYDITDYLEGWELPARGADEFAGEYRTATPVVTLSAVGSDVLATWNDDNSEIFGVHIPLVAGLIMRASFFHVTDGTVDAWAPRWTCEVERWPDYSEAHGQIRTHDVELVDLITALADASIPENIAAQGWSARLTNIAVTAAEWPYGVDIHGYELDATDTTPLELPARDANYALDELRQSCLPLSLEMFAARTGRLVFRPQIGDTWHAAGLATPGTTGTLYTAPIEPHYPDGVVFHWNATGDQIPYVEDLFAVDSDRTAIINHVIATDPGGVYEVEDLVSIDQYRRRVTRTLDLMVANNAAGDRIVARQAYLDRAARGLEVDIDHPGAFLAMAYLDWGDPIEVEHSAGAGRPVLTLTGHVRNVGESVTIRDPGRSINFTLRVALDIASVQVAQPLLPVEDLTITDIAATGLQASWTLPTPVIVPTHVEVRIPELGATWYRYDDSITGFAHLSLEPETAYTVQVRLLRIVDGVITNNSPIRSVIGITDPAAGPGAGGDGGTGGDTDVDVPTFDGCDTGWQLEESEDGVTWTVVASGTTTTSPVALDETTFTAGLLYRMSTREVCAGVPGDWVVGPIWIAPDDWDDNCITPPALAVAPYDDADLVLYVPKVCSPAIISDALSGLEATKGPAFGNIGFDDVGGGLVVSSADEGYILSGEAGTDLDAVAGGDMTISIRVKLGDQPTSALTLLGAGGLFIEAVADGAGWSPKGIAYQAAGGPVEISGPTELDLDTEYYVALVHDVTAETLALYIDAVEEADAALVSERLDPTGWWEIALPDDSYATDAAAWSRALDPSELPSDSAGPGDEKFSGGTITYVGDDVIHTFTSSGTLTFLGGSAVSCRVLVVGGGGGGGARRPGGGGGGGGVNDTTQSIGATQTITVGAGGAPGVGNVEASRNGITGGTSSIGTLVFAGGGGGGAGGASSGSSPGVAGASPLGAGGGGGGGQTTGTTSGGAGQGGSGNGGTGNGHLTSTNRAGGGGGGAGGTGSAATTGAGGNGGPGITSDISGTTQTYGGGGGGAGASSHGAGGAGGGGAGALTFAGDGTANTGGGGGGTVDSSSTDRAGTGGSGIVIVRYTK